MRALLVLLVLLLPAPAFAATLSSDLSSREIAIRSNFNGTSLLLFGSKNTGPKEGPVDIIAVVHGPEQPMTIYRKQRVAGIWVNSRPVRFHNVPGFYVVASNRRLADIAGAEYLRRENIGPDNLVLLSVQDVSPEELKGLRQAVVENRAQAGLYAVREDAVTFPSGDLFRADIFFPARVPVGDYRVLVRMFRGGKEIGRTTTILTVGKQGLEQWIYNTAHQRPLAYGLAAVLLAVAAGWTAAAVFRRR
ncbi:MAG: TIGR02186 family protein [Sphingomonadales bacterium]